MEAAIRTGGVVPVGLLKEFDEYFQHSVSTLQRAAPAE